MITNGRSEMQEEIKHTKKAKTIGKFKDCKNNELLWV